MLKKFLFVLMMLPMVLFADCSKGEKLLNRLWSDMKDGRVECIKKYTSSKFQSVHYDGARTRSQELALIANLHMTSYVLSEIKITEHDDLLIISYFAAVTETINNIPSTSTTPRLTLFQKDHGKWKWVAHANLNHPIA